MATIKAFTDLEQSKKLAEILSIESADMSYIPTDDDERGDTLYTAEIKSEIILSNDDEYIPCWSLAALLDVIPRNLKIVLAINDYYADDKEDKKYAMGSVDNDDLDCYSDNPIDACYEMILKLRERRLL